MVPTSGLAHGLLTMDIYDGNHQRVQGDAKGLYSVFLILNQHVLEPIRGGIVLNIVLSSKN